MYLQHMSQCCTKPQKSSRVGVHKSQSIATMTKERARRNKSAKWGGGKQKNKRKPQRRKEDATPPSLDQHQLDAQVMLQE